MIRAGSTVPDGQGEALRHREPAALDSQETDAARGRLPGQAARQGAVIFNFFLL